MFLQVFLKQPLNVGPQTNYNKIICQNSWKVLEKLGEITVFCTVSTAFAEMLMTRKLIFGTMAIIMIMVILMIMMIMTMVIMMILTIILITTVVAIISKYPNNSSI